MGYFGLKLYLRNQIHHLWETIHAPKLERNTTSETSVAFFVEIKSAFEITFWLQKNEFPFFGGLLWFFILWLEFSIFPKR